MQLQEFFKKNPRIAVAFSGGVDSSYLLYAAKEAGCDVHAYLVNAEFQPKFEIDEAIQMAKQLDVPLTINIMSVFNKPEIIENSSDRCYVCKSIILDQLWSLARADGFSILCDGTNADDDEGDRPGMRALREHSVLSPLRICGLRKADIRKLSKEAGLFTHDKPAYACLATRIPTGTKIIPEYLTMVERAESALFDMGFSDFRVRLIPPATAKIQMPGKQWDEAASRRTEILKNIGIAGFDCAVLDLTTRD